MADGFGNYQAGLQSIGTVLPPAYGNSIQNSGTTAQRDATVGNREGDTWVLTDSNPKYQISVWDGTAWT